MDKLTLELTLTPPLEAALRQAALDEGTSVNRILADALDRELKRRAARAKARRRNRIAALFPELAVTAD